MRRILQGACLLLLVTGVALAILHRSEISPAAIRTFLDQSHSAPVAFLLLQIVASLLFVPRTVLGITAGLVFGFAWGIVWAIVGALAGASVGFALIRWLGLAESLDSTPHIATLMERAERVGWRAVAIMRLTPVPHSVVNTALALTNISWRDYLLGSAIGMLPMTIVQVDIGAAGNMIIQHQRNWIAVCFMLAVGIAASYFLKRSA